MAILISILINLGLVSSGQEVTKEWLQENSNYLEQNHDIIISDTFQV